jgi:hypothetical protein
MITLKQYQSNKNNRLDASQRPDTLHRRIGGAFFPFINMPDIDLSRFGIYKSVQSENYIHKCFIQSLIASGLFTNLEIELMENIINVEKFPRMKIRDICNIFGFNCDVRYRPRDSEKNLTAMLIKSKKLLIVLLSYCLHSDIIV